MLDLVGDCSRFITGSFEIISTSSPHIYHSALALAPRKSIVWRLYQSHARPFVRVVHGVPVSWDTNVAATTRPSDINGVAWSPCNRFIATTWTDATTVDVLDPVTLQRLQTLQFPQDVPTTSATLAFSPDSRVLTCSGCNYQGQRVFVVSWDLQTGGIASIIKQQVPRQCNPGNPSITNSASGNVVGVYSSLDYNYDDKTNTLNTFIFGIASGVHTHSHSFNHNPRAPLLKNIWTEGEFLRFATASATSITIWEMGFTPDATPTEVGIFAAPDGFDPIAHLPVQLLPTPRRFALATLREVLVWDAQTFKFLFRCGPGDASFCWTMCISSNGRFFARSTVGSEVSLWKESPTGYELHKKITCIAYHFDLLLSPSGEWIIAFGGPTIWSWRTESPTTPPSSISTQTHQQDFVLAFSPHRELAVVAAQHGSTATVLDLKSGVLQLIINTSVGVWGLGVVRDTVFVIGDRKVITWNLTAGGRVPGAEVDIEDSSRTIDIRLSWDTRVTGASISPDSRHIAIIGVCYGTELFVYDTSTGARLMATATHRNIIAPHFSPDGRDIWCVDKSGEAEVREVGDRLELRLGGGNEEALRSTVEHPPEGYPWASSHGYRVTKDWWVLGPDGKRLLMLPPHWQSYAIQRVWNGQFLALLHRGLPEPVILDLGVEL